MNSFSESKTSTKTTRIRSYGFFEDWKRQNIVEITQGDEYVYVINLPVGSEITVEAGLLYGRSFVTLNVDSSRAVITLTPTGSSEGMYQLAVQMSNEVSSYTYLRTVVILEPDRDESIARSENLELQLID